MALVKRLTKGSPLDHAQMDNNLSELMGSVDSIANLKVYPTAGLIDKEPIHLQGYYTPGDGGGGDFYWDSTSTETDNGGTIIQATGVTTGRWKRIHFGEVNIRWFGAKGDGTTDDSTAIQNLLSVAVGIGQASIFLGPGDFLLNSQVSESFAGDVRITIQGAGSGATRLIVNNAVGGLSLTSSQRTSPITIRDFAIVSKLANGGTAFEYTVPEGGAQQRRIFEAINIQIGPYDFGTGDYAFNKGLVAEGMYRPYIRNVLIGRSAASTHKGVVGISVDGTFKAHIADSYVNVGVNVGISDIGANGEGLYIVNTTVNGPDVGLWHARDAREPEFWVAKCHFNCVTKGVFIDGAKYGWLVDNLMYVLPTSAADYVDFEFASADGITIRGNTFRQGFSPSRIHYLMDTTNSLHVSPVVEDIRIDDREYSVSAAASIVKTRAGQSINNIEIGQPETLPAVAAYTNIYDIGSSADTFKFTPASITQYRNDAAQGPVQRIDRISDSPTAADSLGVTQYGGVNSVAAEVVYAQIACELADPTAGTEDGELQMFYRNAGVLQKAMSLTTTAVVGETPMLLAVWNGTIFTLKRVSQGATDSAGAGYRTLRVPN